jgi:hydroxymethylpyrimidine/phosphomethylpyrimidine kinase
MTSLVSAFAITDDGASNAPRGVPKRSPPNAVTIAAVDPSGGAGAVADVKAMSACGAYACAVMAALTAQNTQAVTAIQTLPAQFVKQQIETLFADVPIHAVKIGMLATAQTTITVAECLAAWQPKTAKHVVLDPVMVAKSGDSLLAKDAVSAMREALFPQASIITPNLPEAGALLNERAPETLKEMQRAAEKLRRMLPDTSERWVLVKGGHLSTNELVDLLHDGDRMIEIPGQRVDTRNTHGTGCTYSAAIAALLPQSNDVPQAVKRAHAYLARAIQFADFLNVAGDPSTGHGPVYHFHEMWQRGGVMS